MTSKKFNPQEHLIKLKGKDYLQVMHRVQWFRTDYPDGSIQTELLEYQTGLAVCKATVMIDGKVISTGLANADSRDGNPIWKGKEIMKAETAAIGRALAHAGFGTQFTEDEEGDFLADSPVDRKPQKQSGQNKSTQIPAKAENGKKKPETEPDKPPKKTTKSNENEPEWSDNRLAKFIENMQTRFPEIEKTHPVILATNMGIDNLSILGTRKQAWSKIMEYCYGNNYDVMVNWKRYFVVPEGEKGSNRLEFTADPEKKNGHALIRAYGRSDKFKKMLDKLGIDEPYEHYNFGDYDEAKETGQTTDWEPIEPPLILSYKTGGSDQYPYDTCTGVKLPEFAEIF